MGEPFLHFRPIRSVRLRCCRLTVLDHSGTGLGLERVVVVLTLSSRTVNLVVVSSKTDIFLVVSSRAVVIVFSSSLSALDVVELTFFSLSSSLSALDVVERKPKKK